MRNSTSVRLPTTRSPCAPIRATNNVVAGAATISSRWAALTGGLDVGTAAATAPIASTKASVAVVAICTEYITGTSWCRTGTTFSVARQGRVNRSW